MTGPNQAQPAGRAGLSALDFALALLAGAAAFFLYLTTLAPGLLGGDSGEFQFAAWLGGFAHPTGYPLYLILGYLWTHLVGAGDPAWRMNLLSAAFGGLTVGLLYLLAAQTVRLAAPPPGLPRPVVRLSALFSALLFAVTPTFWSQAVITEVYTLQAALVAAILLGLVTWKARESEPGHYRILYLTAFLFGLGLAHHRSTLLLLPAAALFVFQSRKWSGSWRRRFSGTARALPLLLLPVLLYLYIPLRAPRVPYADVIIGPNQVLALYQPTAAWLIQHVTGVGFSSEFRTPAEAVRGGAESLGWLVDELSWAGIALSILGAAWLFRRSRPLFTLTAVAFLTFVIFNLFYGIGDIRVFHIPEYLIAALWAGLGVAAITWALLRTGAPSGLHQGLALAACLAALALPLLLLVQGYPAADRSEDDRAARAWRGVLAGPIPRGAILVSNDRDEMTPLWYLQYVEGLRPDIAGLFPLIDPAPEWADVGGVIDAARRSGRSVFLIKPMPGLEIKYRTEPAGPLVEVTGPAVVRPPQKSTPATFADTVRLAGYDLDPGLAAPGATVSVALNWQPLRRMPDDLTTFVHVVNADGEVIGQSDHKPGGDYYPTGLWKPGELLRDEHTLALGPDLGRPPYRLEAGLYRTQASGLEHLGQPQMIGSLGIARSSDAVPADLAAGDAFVLGDEIALLGNTLAMSEDGLQAQLYWQALGIPSHDYTAFLHVLDAGGAIVAQQDRQPGNGEAPTETWPDGYVLADEMDVSLPADLPAGAYRVVAGLYDAATGRRLSVATEGGENVGDAIPLGEFTWPTP
jgi:hypothetical protein